MSNVINFPAPEEVRTHAEYVKLFKILNPDVDFKEACKLRERPSCMSVKAYFDWCWQQPEAESIHAAYQIEGGADYERDNANSSKCASNDLGSSSTGKAH